MTSKVNVLKWLKLPKVIETGGGVSVSNGTVQIVETGRTLDKNSFPIVDGIKVSFDIKIDITLNDMKLSPYTGTVYKTYMGDEFEKLAKHLHSL